MKSSFFAIALLVITTSAHAQSPSQRPLASYEMSAVKTWASRMLPSVVLGQATLSKCVFDSAAYEVMCEYTANSTNDKADVTFKVLENDEDGAILAVTFKSMTAK